MFPSLCILGRQPALGLAELESLYGAAAVQPIGSQAALLNKPPAEVSFAFLGGTVKFCKALTVLDTADWVDIQKFLLSAVPEHASNLPAGKLKLGLSAYGFKVTAKQLTATGLEIKKMLKNDRSVRVVPNQEPALNSAQVFHNGLTKELGWELIFVKNGLQTIVAQTIAVQDIDAYAARDHGRPKRDSQVGMLPPKLAQIIINLAAAASLNPSCGPGETNGQTVLDPFCGTGVILQEAQLMGYEAYGTDLGPRMVEYAEANIKRLQETFHPTGISWRIEQANATTTEWPYPFSFIASETYLGRPFSTSPDPTTLKKVIQDTNYINKKFLLNLARQIKPGFRLCLALPAWHTGQQVHHLPVLDQLTDMGYNRVKFVHATEEDLIYHREGQVVGRELVTLIRK